MYYIGMHIGYLIKHYSTYVLTGAEKLADTTEDEYVLRNESQLMLQI